jgi:hypothetical protein
VEMWWSPPLSPRHRSTPCLPPAHFSQPRAVVPRAPTHHGQSPPCPRTG